MLSQDLDVEEDGINEIEVLSRGLGKVISDTYLTVQIGTIANKRNDVKKEITYRMVSSC